MTDVLKIISTAEVTEKTKENLRRKSTFIDDVQLTDEGAPLFSWIDISITDLCNRLCTFCPRIDSDLYPNQSLHFSLDTAEKLANELAELGYRGGVVFCGYGEPLLHPKVNELVRVFASRSIRVEIVTNGDRLTRAAVESLFASGLSFLCVSLYDGPHQVNQFDDLFKSAGVSADKYILRDRWHSESDSFGLKLTNRGGVIEFGPTAKSMAKKPCYYPAYSLTIDWNGDVLLCVQDWTKRIKFGNVSTGSIMQIWQSTRLHKIRTGLMCGSRNKSPCVNCNAEGVLHGFNHVNEWMRLEHDQ
jgi:radical SAM protein with 4Fe4S-binding SPASM domain